ncbi:MAG: hypothetical protein A2538_00720 [Candidatus Magasanikbacteria bacterium RIFOXYD2_FULL_41_14]|uniref:Large ribosomal subunit protein bL25 n=1 Tax=Candidatus Magasanikbacteria bacterium RIFOXYD2_FULL_41_14 TaxID=1798709 RepID=A0A1F6PDX2_9BACT|nr:MAG: hypothetical protein A2538_00720 [Candidatus Magasanikbacteria bacterium RIFOXYD2_FULL_41_14]
MDKYLLNGLLRGDQKIEAVRASGGLLVNVYGVGQPNQDLVLPYKEFYKVYQKASESTLIDLQVNGTDAGKVLIQEVQSDPVSGKVVHLDLRRIDMNKSLVVNVELNFVGESPAVKSLGGTLVKSVEEVEVECLPKDLVEHIDVDLSVLKTYDDAIKVKDLPLPAGVVILSPNADNIVATAIPALTEEQIKAMEEENQVADVSKIEVVGKKEELAEGEEAATEGKDAPKDEEKKD